MKSKNYQDTCVQYSDLTESQSYYLSEMEKEYYLSHLFEDIRKEEEKESRRFDAFIY